MSADRWRLVLGRYAQERLPLDGAGGGGDDIRIDAALDYLYGREYAGRGAREDDPYAGGPSAGGTEASDPQLVTWLGEVRDLFDRETVEVVEKHALDRYGLTGLLQDPETLARLEPNESLLRTLLALKGHLRPPALEVARRLIAQVVEDLRRRLEADVRPAVTGRRSRHRTSPIPLAADFDPRATIRRNLRHWDAERRVLVIERARFLQRNTPRLPWDVIICVDQSGSMAGSVIHSAVMAGILAGLPAFRIKLVVFDTQVVDLTDRVDDPVEVLMSVQLGGGTDIGRALAYCTGLVDNPHRTVIVLVTDFVEGGRQGHLEAVTASLVSERVRLLGLASLDDAATPIYDRGMAERLAALGMSIAALTPRQLAQWLVEVTS